MGIGNIVIAHSRLSKILMKNPIDKNFPGWTSTIKKSKKQALKNPGNQDIESTGQTVQPIQPTQAEMAQLVDSTPHFLGFSGPKQCSITL